MENFEDSENSQENATEAMVEVIFGDSDSENMEENATEVKTMVEMDLRDSDSENTEENAAGGRETMANFEDPENSQENATKVEFSHQNDFLDEIHTRFLKYVEPRTSPLLDHLMETVMESSDEQEIKAEVIRRDQARKLWQFFQRVPSKEFHDHCYPPLKKLYPHVLGDARYIYNAGEGDVQKCVRHVIMSRVNLRRFADLFIAAKGCTLEEYNKMTVGKADNTLWEVAFELCARNKHNAIFIQQLQAFLQDIKVRVPDYFSALLSEGFPCICSLQNGTCEVQRVLRTTQSTNRLAKRMNFKRSTDRVFLHPQNFKSQKGNEYTSSCGYPSTRDDSIDNENCSTASISSHETRETTMKDGEGEESRFDTKDQKDAWLEELKKMTAFIKKASNIRTFFRELAGIKDEIDILREMAKSETVYCSDDQDRVCSLLDRAREIYETMQTDFKEVENASKMAEDTGLPFNFEPPFTKRTILLQRRQMLLNEMKEASVFFKQAEHLFHSRSFLLCASHSYDVIYTPKVMPPISYLHWNLAIHPLNGADGYKPKLMFPRVYITN